MLNTTQMHYLIEYKVYNIYNASTLYLNFLHIYNMNPEINL